MKVSFLLFSVSVSILIIISPAITENYVTWDSGDSENENLEYNENEDFESYDNWYSGNYENRNSAYYDNRNPGYYDNRNPEYYGNRKSWNRWDWRYWWNLRDWQRWNRLWDAFGITKDMGKNVVPLTELRLYLADGTEVYPGQKVSGAKTFLIHPNVEWECENDKLYTLIFVDLDILLQKKGYQYLLWRVDGIRGCGGVKSGVTTVPYTGPIVLPATGTHRFAVLVFPTNHLYTNGLNTKVQSVAGRDQFNAAEFMRRNGVIPVAGSFFTQKNPVAGNINVVKALPRVRPIL